MINRVPTILALDFDGVICDGIIEYFQTTKRTYDRIWNQNQSISNDDLVSKFNRLRPVIESGWEMPILLRAIILGHSEEEIFQNWSPIARQILESERLDRKELSKALDTVRDEWIASDLDEWLSLHRFYPGVIERINCILNSQTKFYIVTTKEDRFVTILLQLQGINLHETFIFGKKYQRPKHETLRKILKDNSAVNTDLWFVEDRLEALDLVKQQPDLEGIKLYLADWGYNTKQTRDSIHDRNAIKLLSLEQFKRDFSYWD